VCHTISDCGLESIGSQLDTEVMAVALRMTAAAAPGISVIPPDYLAHILRGGKATDASVDASALQGARHLSGRVFSVALLDDHYVFFDLDNTEKVIRIVDPLASSGLYEGRARAAASALDRWLHRERKRLSLPAKAEFAVETNYPRQGSCVPAGWALNVTEQSDSISCGFFCIAYLLFLVFWGRLPTTADLISEHSVVLRVVVYLACTTGRLELVLPPSHGLPLGAAAAGPPLQALSPGWCGRICAALISGMRD
jgi:hypothetical protein